MDFTLRIYKEMLTALQTQGFSFQTFADYSEDKVKAKVEVKVKGDAAQPQPEPQPLILLRHDVDLLPGNSLATAKLEHALGIKGSYYFRAVPESWAERIIREIAGLGHEIGYHYESLTTCNGDMEKAYHDFTANLEKLRRLAPVSTICMHGSPRSPWDSKDLWKHYDYRSLGITGEPYFDTDFSEFFYLTDTGRRWDGWKFSVRDKIPVHQDRWIAQGLVFQHTGDIINAARTGTLPPRVMITVHPQRWNDAFLPWAKELLWQNVKNQGKLVLLAMRSKKKEVRSEK
ncbi:hypothetical protein TBC1_11497 [Lentimicrobium saccharophilum]|uniref:Polysaccharide deacetylase n=1 Tax=Lentimicrobium saccharophilum TaxID=1678841 RepID=A0A0S7BZT7_9BACT|nr:hypothetical protein [Lentimicrobium saccharophilum]GAP42368.1 hypothetical protein TBC1_11497 [Lentimicrobium saccharophilum]